MYNPDAYSNSYHEASSMRGPAPLRHDGHEICVWKEMPSVPPNWPEIVLGYGAYGQQVRRPMQRQDAINFTLRAITYLTLPGIVKEGDREDDPSIVLQAALTLLEARQKIGPLRFPWERHGVEEQIA